MTTEEALFLINELARVIDQEPTRLVPDNWDDIEEYNTEMELYLKALKKVKQSFIEFKGEVS